MSEGTQKKESSAKWLIATAIAILAAGGGLAGYQVFFEKLFKKPPPLPVFLEVPSLQIPVAVPHTSGDLGWGTSWVHFESDVHFELKNRNLSARVWASFQEASPTQDIGGTAYVVTQTKDDFFPETLREKLTESASLPDRGTVSKVDERRQERVAIVAAPSSDKFVRETKYELTDGASEQKVTITTRPIRIKLRDSEPPAEESQTWKVTLWVILGVALLIVILLLIRRQKQNKRMESNG